MLDVLSAFITDMGPESLSLPFLTPTTLLSLCCSKLHQNCACAHFLLHHFSRYHGLNIKGKGVSQGMRGLSNWKYKWVLPRYV